VVKTVTDLGNLLEDLLLLIDLDGIDATEISVVLQFLDGLGKRVVQQGELCIEKILDTQQNRHPQAAFLQAADDRRKGHADILPRKGRNAELAIRRDLEISTAPVVHAVEFRGTFHGPFFESPRSHQNPPPRCQKE